MRGSASGSNGVEHGLSHPRPENHFKQDRREEPTQAENLRKEQRERYHGGRRKQWRDNTRAAKKRDWGLLAPTLQRPVVDGGANLLAHEREVFPQIDAVAQFRHGLLPRDGSIALAGREQPFSEGALSRRSAGGRKELEHRAAAEQIEVVGIAVLGIAKPLALRTRADPFILYSRQGPLVVRDRPRCCFQRVVNAPVHDGQRNKHNNGGEQPPRRNPS